MGQCKPTPKTQTQAESKYKETEIQIKFSLSSLTIQPPEFEKGQVYDLFVEIMLNNKPLQDKDKKLYAKNLDPFTYSGQIQQQTEKNLEIDCTIQLEPQQSNYFLTFSIEMQMKNLSEKTYTHKIDNPKIDTTDIIDKGIEMKSYTLDFTYGETQGQMSFTIFKYLSQDHKYLPQDKYHEEVIIDKFTDLFKKANGWIFKNFTHNLVYKDDKKTLSIIAIIGMFSKGKSHIAKKITNVNIPEGNHINTLGPSILYTENCKLIDSPGKGVPLEQKLLNQNQESIQEMLEKTVTEQFITEYCIEQSNIIFFVVGLLSVFEQKDIMNIKGQFRDANLIVIHNFYELTKKEDIYQKIWEDIYFSFENVTAFRLPNIPEKDKSKYFGYGFNSFIGDQSIRHLVLANTIENLTDFKDPDYFNLPVMKYIKEIAPDKIIPEVKFIDSVIQSALKKSKTYLNITGKLPEIQLQKQKTDIANQDKHKILPKKEVRFDLKLAYEQSTNSQSTNSQLTFSSSKYEPYYALTFQHNQKQSYIFEMELKIYATVRQKDFKCNNIKIETVDQNNLKVTGKLIPSIPKQLKIEKTHRNTLPSEEFEIIIKMPQYITWNNSKFTLKKFRQDQRVPIAPNEKENSVSLKLNAQKIPYTLTEFEFRQNQLVKIDFPDNEEFMRSKPNQYNLLPIFKKILPLQQNNTNAKQNQNQVQKSTSLSSNDNTLVKQQQSQNTIQEINLEETLKQIKKEQGQYDLKFTFYEELIDTETHFVFCVVYSSKKNLEILKAKQNWKIIGLTGSYKKGKSFIALKLFNKAITHGHESTTTGISIMMDEERSTLILDTEGFERAISFYQNSVNKLKKINIKEDQFKNMDMIKFRNIFEDIVQNFILNQSDAILIVLSDLTFTDQLLLKTCYQNTPPERKFIIVHNFLRYQAISHVESKITENQKDKIGNIWKYFDLQKVRLSDEVINNYTTEEQRKFKIYNSYFIENQKDTSKKFIIYHVIIAREGTEAGKYYNQTFLAFLQYQINGVKNQLIRNSVVSSFQDHLNQKISDFYKIEGNEQPNNTWEFKEFGDNNILIEYYYKKFKGKLEKHEFAKLLREVKFHSVIQPPYFWSTKRQVKETISQSLVLSLPGGEESYTELKAEIQWNQGTQDIFITGRKKQYIKQENEDLICTNSNEGKIELKVKIPDELRILNQDVKWKEGTSLAEIVFQSLENL